MADVKLTHVKKIYSNKVEVLHDINLDIKQGEFIVFVGPSGCGKSTLLRMISGLEDISGGTLEIDGKVMNDVPPALRGIAMVFQSYALYPHMSVYDNMAFSLQIAKASKADIDKQVRKAAEMLQLTPYLDRLPKALSGGQRQRVAIGRAIVRSPQVFLFDEPLSNLDAALRVATRMEIANLKDNMPDSTMIYVTHDQVEAMTLADRLVVLNKGKAEQIGTPMELYNKPASTFVAAFIGSPAMNLLDAEMTEAGVKLNESLVLPFSHDYRGKMIWGIRPEHLVASDEQNGDVALQVQAVESLGAETLIHGVLVGSQQTDGSAVPLVVRLSGPHLPDIGSHLWFTAPREDWHLFDANTQQRL